MKLPNFWVFRLNDPTTKSSGESYHPSTHHTHGIQKAIMTLETFTAEGNQSVK